MYNEHGINFDNKDALFQTFDNEHDVLEAFERHQDMRIFFITSGTLGQTVIPKIISRYGRTLTDTAISVSYNVIYIFCADLENHFDWIVEYAGFVEVFTSESPLLERLIWNLTQYYVDQGNRFSQSNKIRNALQCYYWVKEWLSDPRRTEDRHYHRATVELKNVNQLIQMTAIKLSVFGDPDGDKNDGKSE